MLDRGLIRQQPDKLRRSLQRRGLDAAVVDELLELDASWRACITAIDEAKQERNAISARFAAAKQGGGALEALRAHSTQLGAQIAQRQADADTLEASLNGLLAHVPNLLCDDVPEGADSRGNVEVRRFSEPPSLAFPAKPHWELGEQLDILDFERGVRLARSRFAVLKGQGARLNRALTNFLLERNTGAGFVEIMPPLLVNRATVEATGHLSKFSDLMFTVADGSLFLSPTAEVQLVNLHREEILDDAALPLRYTAYTHCFRQEAGAAGKDTRGLVRQHQFEKVELVTLCRPQESELLHQALVAQAESLLKALQLPFRVMLLCSADTGFAACKTYDLEVWLPSQNEYREISSCSNCADFQARRAGIRYRPQAKAKPEFVHTLNGSALPLGRTLLAIMENYQDEDGSIRIPDVLQPYMDGLQRIAKADAA